MRARNLNPALRVLVMSATLDGAAVARLLGDAPLISAPGAQFPGDHTLPGSRSAAAAGGAGAAPDTPERRVTQLIRRALREAPGDVLAFLPGAREIRRVQASSQQLPRAHVAVLPLFGDLAGRGAGRRAAPGRRRHAQGRARHQHRRDQPHHPRRARRGRLGPDAPRALRSGHRHEPPGDAAHLARLGRAAPRAAPGAPRPGVCYRAWSEGAQAALAAFTPPGDRSMRTWRRSRWSWPAGARAMPRDLRWLDPPPAAMLASARDLLRAPGCARCAGAHQRARARDGAPAACTRAWRTCCCARARSGSCALAGAARGAAVRARPAARRPVRAMPTSARASSCCAVRAAPRRSIASTLRARPPRRARTRAAARAGRGAAVPGGCRGMPGAGCCSPSPIRTASARRRAGGEGRYALTSGRGARFAEPQGLARAGVHRRGRPR